MHIFAYHSIFDIWRVLPKGLTTKLIIEEEYITHTK